MYKRFSETVLEQLSYVCPLLGELSAYLLLELDTITAGYKSHLAIELAHTMSESL